MNSRFALTLMVLSCSAVCLPPQARSNSPLSAYSRGSDDLVFRIVGHNAIEMPDRDRMLRLYVQLRRSEEDPLPPNFKPRASLFKLGSAFGDATIKDIGTFGGKKAKG